MTVPLLVRVRCAVFGHLYPTQPIAFEFHKGSDDDMDPDLTAYLCTCSRCNRSKVFISSLPPWALPWNSHSDNSYAIFREADADEIRKVAESKLLTEGIYAKH